MNSVTLSRVRKLKGGAGEAKSKNQLPNAAFANELMEKPEFLNYIAHHGNHFTDKLADWATKQMENGDGSSHNWTSTQVAKALEPHRAKMPAFITDGDLAFAANMCYADFFPSIAKTEEDCLKYAMKTAMDPDGYDGMIFSRWLSDVIGKEIEVKWGEVC